VVEFHNQQAVLYDVDFAAIMKWIQEDNTHEMADFAKVNVQQAHYRINSEAHHLWPYHLNVALHSIYSKGLPMAASVTN
jgi:hypothetical protein